MQTRNVDPQQEAPPPSRHGSTAAVDAGGAGQRGFVAAALASCFFAIAFVLALNVTVDPFATAGTHLVPTAVENDRSIKLTLLEQLRYNPEILILGSSRARQAEPAYLEGLTSHEGFNGAVTGGTAADAYVFTRFAADRFAAAGRRYIWFVDAGIATNGVNPQLRDDPRARRYLGGSAGFTLKDVGAYLGAQATRAAWRVVLKCVVGSCRPNVRYNPDGSIPHSALTNLPEHAKNLQADVAKLVQSIRDHPPRPVSVDPRRYVHFEKALAFMNAHGSTPVIVLNPIYPSILRELEKYGFPERRASLEYLGKLHRRFKFVVVNAEDIRSWGGSPQNFANATHIDWVNMRRLLKYIASRPGTPLR